MNTLKEKTAKWTLATAFTLALTGAIIATQNISATPPQTQEVADGLTSPTNNPAAATADHKLSWDKLETTIKTGAGEYSELEKVKAVFVATNHSSSPVTIERIDKSCGCTSVSLSQSNIPSLGSATLTAEIAVGNLGGLSKKFITVRELGGDSTQLCVTLNSPFIGRFLPQSLKWSGGPNNTQTIRFIQDPTSTETSIASVKSLAPTFTASFRKTSSKEWVVDVTPTANPVTSANSSIKIETKNPKRTIFIPVESHPPANIIPNGGAYSNIVLNPEVMDKEAEAKRAAQGIPTANDPTHYSTPGPDPAGEPAGGLTVIGTGGEPNIPLNFKDSKDSKDSKGTENSSSDRSALLRELSDLRSRETAIINALISLDKKP